MKMIATRLQQTLVDKAKAQFRSAYEILCRKTDYFPCGLTLAVEVSTEVAEAVRECLRCLYVLRDIDPDFPSGGQRQIDTWEKVLNG
jgi:hypothetical protein